MNSNSFKKFIGYLFITTLTGCPMCDDKDNGGGDLSSSQENIPKSSTNPGVASQPQGPTASVVPNKTQSISTATSPDGHSLFRISPEQVSNALKKTVGFADFRGHDPYLNEEYDRILDLFSVGLGGIDFTSASFRDPTTKAQTILISRIVAWFAAKRTVQNDAFGGIWGGKRIFLDDAVFADPTQPGDKIFDDHVKDLFWRLYSRPPSETEINAVNATWLDIYSQAAGGTFEKAMRSWMAVLYAMFSSQEFWHI